MKGLQLGDITVTRVVEFEGETSPRFLFEEGVREDFKVHEPILAPHFYVPSNGRMLMSIHCFVVRTRHHTVLVDTCIGNHKKRDNPLWNMLDGPFLADLAKAGVAPEAVDYVLCTHLHVDHVGWNTRLEDGKWVPTFPNARYLFAKTEWEHWKQVAEPDTREIIADSVLPIIEADRADLVEGDYAIDDELRLEPTPGHTPGHVSLRLSSNGKEAVITGDMIHHPIQIVAPQWSSTFCVDPEQARATRRDFLSRYADRDVLILGTHFASPTVGHIVGHGDTWRLKI